LRQQHIIIIINIAAIIRISQPLWIASPRSWPRANSIVEELTSSQQHWQGVDLETTANHHHHLLRRIHRNPFNPAALLDGIVEELASRQQHHNIGKELALRQQHILLIIIIIASLIQILPSGHLLYGIIEELASRQQPQSTTSNPALWQHHHKSEFEIRSRRILFHEQQHISTIIITAIALIKSSNPAPWQHQRRARLRNQQPGSSRLVIKSRGAQDLVTNSTSASLSSANIFIAIIITTPMLARSSQSGFSNNEEHDFEINKPGSSRPRNQQPGSMTS